MSPPALRTSLLGLPIELRLKIYHFVITTDINCQITDNVQESFEEDVDISRSSDVYTICFQQHLSTWTNFAAQIPWLNLRLTCKAVANELDSFMTSNQFLNNDCNRVYVLDLDIYSTPEDHAVRRLVWRKIPCAPTYARDIVIAVRAGGIDESQWVAEDGATYAITMIRVLWQILNHLCHNGPRLETSNPLEKHMRFRQAKIFMGEDYEGRPTDDECDVVLGHQYVAFVDNLGRASGFGVLCDYFDSIHMSSRRHGEKQLLVSGERPSPLQLAAAHQYGFGWGV